jgi:hypothetical protein
MKTTIAILVLVLIAFFAVLVAGAHIQARGHIRALNHYREVCRPGVIAALEAYKADHGAYPDYLTNATTQYYTGLQQNVWFWEGYYYTNFGTNYYLKHF